jgi:16S rRNA (cytosine967-C5)-methyltransferase
MGKDDVKTGKSGARGVPARRMAVEVLIAVERDGAYATLALNAAFNRKQLSERDRAFVTALVQGCVRHRMELDQKISALSKQPLEKMPESLKNILRVGIFQIEHMSDMPPSAIVDTSTELAKVIGHQGQARFVNGLLRNYLRQRPQPGTAESTKDGAKSGPGTANDTEGSAASDGGTTGDAEAASSSNLDAGDTAPDTATTIGITSAESLEQLSVQYSMPEWLVQRWMENYGRDETIKLLQFAQSTPELAIRVCEMSVTVEGFEQVLRSRNIRFHRSNLVPSCLIIDSKKQGSPEKLPGYADGLFSVQDESAALVSKVVDARPGKEVIVDLCAAPGGKSLHMAEMMENSGRVIAVDKHASRLNLLKENRQRLGLTNIEIFAADGRSFTLEKPADRVLLDAPCTGTGVVNRRSDLRFRREAVDIGSLTELQRELLNNAADLVKPGGILVYATCSIEPEENFDNIRWFMRERSDFEGDDLTPFLPQHLQEELHSCWTGPACKTESEMTTAFMLQLLPSRHGVSGFFICRLRKKP